MKFNWRANWEVLLVLAIIVVGIVITTIAAIRNKDKHLQLPIAEENDFSQLFTNGNGVALDGSVSQQAAEVHSGNEAQIASIDHDYHSTRKPQSQSMIKNARSPANHKSPRSQPSGSANDDLAPTGPSAGALDQYPATTGIAQVGNHDFYESTSTEPPPPVDRSEASSSSSANKPASKLATHHHLSGSKRHVNDTHRGYSENERHKAGSTPNDLDDIHTTRSSLAGKNDSSLATGASPQQDLMTITPSVAFHGPYGNINSRPIEDSSDMMVDNERLSRPFARSPSNNSDYHNQAALANLLSSMPQSSNDHFDAAFGGQITQPPANYRGYTGSLPISLLLGDLLKLTHPNFGNSPSASETSNQYAQGIMQQIRSLPGPLMSLLQTLPSLSQQTSDRVNGSPPSNDASESNQHYHRISVSPTDLHSILARSISRSNTLPAFPPPKGATEPWISVTSGGSPNYTEAGSSNADFIAANTAGFVRALQQQQQQAGLNQGEPQQQQQSPQHHQQQQSQQHHQQQQSQQHHQQQQSQQYQQQQHSDYYQKQMEPSFNALGHHQGDGSARMSSDPSVAQRDQQAYANYQTFANNPAQDVQSHLYYPNGHLSNQQYLQTSGPQAPIYNQAPVYNSHIASEVSVPLGYSPPPQLQLQTSQHQNIQQRLPIDFSSLGVESSPGASVVNSANQKQAAFNRQPINLGSISQNRQSTNANSNTRSSSRRKRSLSREEQKEREFEAYASKRDVDDDVDEDSYPLSVVSTDGRPMSNIRFRGLARPSNGGQKLDRYQTAQSQRASSHMDSKQYQKLADKERSAKIKSSTKKKKMMMKNRKIVQLDTAGSGLMSKLLGTASTNDDSEMDADMDDDDDANERRKEELEDAEFGIVNDDRHHHRNQEDQNSATDSPDVKANVEQDAGDVSRTSSSASVGESTYSKRNQPRSDIEFYGHPGEETRQLKYGILGSGNYEVVNGGIYPEADESTAAVNSVANYVRKPGGLLANLPKMLSEPIGRQHMNAFMPGGRIGGFLRGASTNPHDDYSALMGPAELGSKDLSGPILDLIDGGHYLDANLINQLSSGSSSRTIHTSKEGNSYKKKGKSKTKASTTYQPSVDRDSNQLQQQQSSISGSRSFGTNQFNSYQILPSKKVTIFSDQDLDSAPSGMRFAGR